MNKIKILDEKIDSIERQIKQEIHIDEQEKLNKVKQELMLERVYWTLRLEIKK